MEFICSLLNSHLHLHFPEGLHQSKYEVDLILIVQSVNLNNPKVSFIETKQLLNLIFYVIKFEMLFELPRHIVLSVQTSNL